MYQLIASDIAPFPCNLQLIMIIHCFTPLILLQLIVRVIGEHKFLHELHQQMQSNKFCNLPYHHQTLLDKTKSGTQFNQLIIAEYEGIPIRFYQTTYYRAIDNALTKLKIVFAFLNEPSSILCVKLLRSGEYFHFIANAATSNIQNKPNEVAKLIYQTFTRDVFFVASIRSIFNEPAMQNFVYPSFHCLGLSWMNQGQTFASQVPDSLEFSYAFQSQIASYVQFFSSFYNQVKPTDKNVFRTLLQELGRRITSSKLLMKLFFEESGTVAEKVTDLYFFLSKSAQSSEWATCIVKFILDPKVANQIIAAAAYLNMSESYLSMSVRNSQSYIVLQQITEVSIKALFVQIFPLSLPRHDWLRTEENRATVITAFTVALCNTVIDSTAIRSFVQEVFGMNEFINPLSKFSRLVGILRPEFLCVDAEHLQTLEKLYLLNHFKGTLIRFFLLFKYSEVSDIADAIIRRIDAIYEETDGTTDDESNAYENNNSIEEQKMFEKEQEIMDKSNVYPLESVKDLRQAIKMYKEKVSK